MPNVETIHYNPPETARELACGREINDYQYSDKKDRVTCGNCKRSRLFRKGETK